jgi:tRNA (cmo5U34)-methyltransferase
LSGPPKWNEADSASFLDYGPIFTPYRDDIAAAILELIPSGPDTRFSCADVGAGDGWLGELVLERFASSRLVVLDGSEAMLERATARLARFGDRVEYRRAELTDDRWMRSLPGDIRCVMSAMALHHLNDPQKRLCYRLVQSRLEAGGALLIADIVAPASERERTLNAGLWDEDVKRCSLARASSLLPFDRFQIEEWNWFRYRDPADKPAKVIDHLQWLREAGFESVGVFWLRAGHAVFGGFKRP